MNLPTQIQSRVAFQEDPPLDDYPIPDAVLFFVIIILAGAILCRR